MKKVIILLSVVFIFATEIDLNISEKFSPEVDKNKTILTDYNFSETNKTSFTEKNSSIEENVTEETIETFDENFYSQNPTISFALIIEKQKFFKFLPSLINSINAYLLQKGIDFNFSVYNNDVNISNLPQKYIIDIETNKSKILTFKDYNKTFFVPLFNRDDFNETFSNIYFGGLNFKNQIDIFNNFINDNLYTISQNSQLSLKLLRYESENPFFVKNFNFPYINYNELNSSFVILNTDTEKSAQVLSNITSKEIKPLLLFSPQLCYSPAIIFLTQPQDTKKLLIANSIINPPLLINDYATLLNSNIRYNWLNYSTNILINKIYNMDENEDLFYMSDFHIYIFKHQIDYKTKLYKIENGAFKEVE